MESVSASLNSFKPEMGRIQNVLFASTLSTFMNQGRPVTWAPLSDATIKLRKARAKRGKPPTMGLTTILIDQAKLLASVTGNRGEYAQSEVSDNFTIVATSNPQAARLQKGDPSHNLPARPFLQITPTDRDAALDVLSRGIQSRIIAVQGIL